MNHQPIITTRATITNKAKTPMIASKILPAPLCKPVSRNIPENKKKNTFLTGMLNPCMKLTTLGKKYMSAMLYLASSLSKT